MYTFVPPHISTFLLLDALSQVNSQRNYESFYGQKYRYSVHLF